jgi:hypothetical protein
LPQPINLENPIVLFSISGNRKNAIDKNPKKAIEGLYFMIVKEVKLIKIRKEMENGECREGSQVYKFTSSQVHRFNAFNKFNKFNKFKGLIFIITH